MKILRSLAVALALMEGTAYGAGAVRQESPQALNLSSASTTTSTAFGMSALAGSTIEAWVTGDTSGTTAAPTSVVDSASQTYTLRCQINSVSLGQQLLLYTFSNNASATALTVTATWGTAVAGSAVWTKEITGVTTSAYQACLGATQTNPGTAANAITTGTMTGGTAPALISGLTVNFSATNAITAGTLNPTFTLGTVGFSPGTANGSSSESGHWTTSTPSTTFTDATNGAAGDYITIGAIYTDSGAAAAHSHLFIIQP